MSARTVAVFAQGMRSAGWAAGAAAARLAMVGFVALVVNWLAVLFVLPAGGPVSAGAQMLIFGIAFPIGWLIAAQPYAVASGLRRFYRENRDQLLSLIAGAIEQEAGGGADPAPERWLRAVSELRGHIDRYPRMLRPLLRLGLRRAGIEDIERALQSGSGPAPLRIAAAVADRLEAEFAGSTSAVWLGAAGAANLLGYGLVFMTS